MQEVADKIDQILKQMKEDGTLKKAVHPVSGKKTTRSSPSKRKRGLNKHGKLF